MNNLQLRLFVIAVLDDGNGISREAFGHLTELNTDGSLNDIMERVESAEERFYLPEDHNITA